MQRRGLSPGAKVLSIEITEDDLMLIDELGASPDENFVKLQRIGLADDKPMAVETSHLRRKFCPGIEDLDFQDESLYRMLKEKFNVKLKDAEQ